MAHRVLPQSIAGQGFTADEIEKLPHDRFQSLLSDLVLTKLVDNYLSFLIDMLALVLRTKPDILRSGDQERVDFILQFATMEELVGGLVEKKIEKLAYAGTHELAKYFADHLGIELFKSTEEGRIIAEAIEIRNILVHTHGVVSKMFKSRLPDFPAEVGERVSLDRQQMSAMSRALVMNAGGLEKRLRTKFQLPLVSG